MGPYSVSVVLVIVLGITATLPGPTMGQAGGNSAANERDSQPSELSNCQTGIDTRLNRMDTRLNRMDTQLNRMDSRLDVIETALTDMKEFLIQRLKAMELKAEIALTGRKHTDYRVPKDCREAYTMGHTSSGVYRISPEPNLHMDVYCDQTLDKGGWIVIQQRKDGSEDFYRKWKSYKEGFGSLTGEFWFGNHRIHLLTKHQDQQLKVELTSPEGEIQYADYEHFSIGNETQKYRLNVRGYSGGSTPGDSLSYSNGYQFSTLDEDNDSSSSSSCASLCHGAWWYRGCALSNLNGQYEGSGGTGVHWGHWKGHTSLRGTRMMVRRRT